MKNSMTTYCQFGRNRNSLGKAKSLQVETLEGRRLLAVVLPGDANQDLHFDAADFVQVFKAGKFETNEAATWAEGDWNGGPGENGPSVGDGVFTSHDLVSAFQASRFNNGAYDAEAGDPVHSRIPISQEGVADTTIGMILEMARCVLIRVLN